jgi:UrcA family protein
MNKSVAVVCSSRASSISKCVALAAVGAFGLLAGASNAFAQLDVPQVRVDFADLDLTQTKDAKRLYSRLRLAASEVCSGHPDQGGSLRNTPRKQCEQRAVTNAVEAVGHPALLTLHTSARQTKLAQRSTKTLPSG